MSNKELPPLPKHLMIFDQSDDSSFGSLVEHAWDSDYATMKVGDPMFTADQMRDYARAALAAQPVAQAPEGMRLVPIEPTPAMLDAGQAGFRSYCLRHMYGHPAVWAAMLAAAPSPEASKPVQAEAPIARKELTIRHNGDGEPIGLTGRSELMDWLYSQPHESVVRMEVFDGSLATQPTASNAGERDAKPCLVSGTCEHGNWCSDVYCQEHCRFFKELDQLDALAELCEEATGGWDLPPTAVYRIGKLARKVRAALATKPLEQKPVAYLSWGGFNLSGDRKSIDEANRLLHEAGIVPELRALLAEARVAQPEQVAQDREHAENYRLIRRGQHWSIVDGIGNTLRGDDLDAAVDAIRAARASGQEGGT